jgi:hypothetical protein
MDRRARSLLPCASCPWRVNQDASVIPNYNQAKAEHLLGTVGADDGFRPIMACHGSAEEKPAACKGYLAREGWSNLGVRLLLIRGQIESPDAVLAACQAHSIELEPDYPTVLDKLSGMTDEPEEVSW